MSDDEDEDGAEDQAAALNNIVQPLRKQMKKHGSKIEKLDGSIKALEKEVAAEFEKRGGLEKTLTEIQTGAAIMKGTIDSHPWRSEGERMLSELRSVEKRLADSLDEQRVQLAAHAQVFQSTQTTVSSLSQSQSSLQADHHDGSRRAAEELRGLTARLDHMRGEFSERVTHSFSESTAHADRLTQRLQQDIQRLEQDVSQRAQTKAMSDSTASIQSELHELRASNEDLRREVRASNMLLQELRDAQQGYALKSSIAGSVVTSEQRIASLEETVARLDASLREVSGTVNDTRLGQRLVLIEARQATLERAQKQLELQIGSLGEELAHRPLKTDVISAIAQQELLVEACAPREAFEKLEATVEACAAASTVAALGETVRTLSTQLTTAATSLGDLKESAASKATLQQRGKEIESLRTRLDEKLSRDECVSLLASKLEKSEARSIVQQQEQMQASVIATEAMAKRLQESLSSTSNHAHDATGTVREISSRIDRLSSLTQELDGRMTARRNELTSLTKVVRLILDDAEMRCAIDEAEGATAAEASDVLQRLRGAGARNGGAPMSVSGVTLHKPAGGPLQPLPPGAAGADKVWYKSSLLPRTEVLGQRRRLLVNARHSWVGEACLARGDDEPSRAPHPPISPRESTAGGGSYIRGANMGSSGGNYCTLEATPSSTGAPPEPPA